MIVEGDFSNSHQKYFHVRHTGNSWGAMASLDHFAGSYDFGWQFSVIMPELMHEESHRNWFHPYIGFDLNLGLVQFRSSLWFQNGEERNGREEAERGDHGSPAEAQDMQEVT